MGIMNTFRSVNTDTNNIFIASKAIALLVVD